MRLSVTTTGAEEFRSSIAGLANGLQNPRGFVEMGRLLSERAVRRNFQAQVDSKGKPWPALKTRPGGRPLVNRQGRMPKGITSRAFARGWQVAAGSATRAFNAVHNFGSRMWLAGKGGNPQRQYMFLSKQAIKEIATQLRIYVAKLVKK